MVRGLELFGRHFAAHTDQYVLIGGAAASLVMRQAELEFRATKDLDVVLLVEALTPAFGEAFWAFVVAGGYQQQEESLGNKPRLYRFQKPTDPAYPAMVELFSRNPAGFSLAAGSHLTPIPLDEGLASPSAILLDEASYAFIKGGCLVLDGLSCVGAERLVPLKARAWLDLSARKEQGEEISTAVIRKHARDVFQLAGLFAPDTRVELPATLAESLAEFLERVSADEAYNPTAWGLRGPKAEWCHRLALTFGLVPSGGDPTSLQRNAP